MPFVLLMMEGEWTRVDRRSSEAEGGGGGCGDFGVFLAGRMDTFNSSFIADEEVVLGFM